VHLLHSSKRDMARKCWILILAIVFWTKGPSRTSFKRTGKLILLHATLQRYVGWLGVLVNFLPFRVLNVCNFLFWHSPQPNADTWLLPPLAEKHKNKKCLVLDMDETLIHSSFKVQFLKKWSCR
jgi:hypothetical protein